LLTGGLDKMIIARFDYQYVTAMSKTTRKGIKIKTPFPFAEIWYEQTIEGLKEDVKKRSAWSLFGRSKNETDLARRFREFLSMAEKDIEVQLWFAKSFAVQSELCKEADSRLDHLFGKAINIFNRLLQNFDVNRLSEESLTHLKDNLKLLNGQAERLWGLQGIGQDPQSKERAKKLIEDFNQNLNDFDTLMQSYQKSEENKPT
jgi:hypothetical protein